MRSALQLALLAATTASFAQAEGLTPAPGKQVATSVQIKTTGESPREVEVPLLLYTPEGYHPAGEAYPLVLFLHGLGESGDGGDQLQRVATHGPPKLAAAGKSLPFILVSPQCPQPHGWANVVAAWKPELLLPLLDRVEKELNVDVDREYVTGLSMGGFGSWRLALATPDRFAAAAPICGGGDPSSVTDQVAGLPIWAFHGDSDPVVPVALSRDMVKAVNLAGGNARLTTYPGVGHDSWSATYDNPMFFDWLLGHRRGDRH